MRLRSPEVALRSMGVIGIYQQVTKSVPRAASAKACIAQHFRQASQTGLSPSQPSHEYIG
jgi:hypothetical protein